MPCYADLLALKRTLGVEALDTLRDADYLRALEAASEDIDAETGRTFQPYTGTKLYSYVPGGWGVRYDRPLWIDDLLSATTLIVAGATWAPTDYLLLPLDAPAHRRPYTRIGRATDLVAFSITARAVALTGLWGYWQELVATGVTLGAAVTDATGTGITLSGGFVVAGQTILIDAEQMFIEAVAGAATTVRRGVNGTTATTHTSGTAIWRYAYPRAVVQAALALAVSDLGAQSRGGVTQKRAGDLSVTYGVGETANLARQGTLAPLRGLRRRALIA